MAEKGQERVFTSFSLAGRADQEGLLTEVANAIEEVLERFDLKGGASLNPEVGYWAQDGGWYQDLEDPWGQKGGWVEDLEGRFGRDMQRLDPAQRVIRDVFAAFNRALTPYPDDDEEPLGPPRPKPGPGPDPGPETRGA